MMQLHEDVPATWGIAEASAFLGCTQSTLRTWVSKRRVPFCRVGRLVRFRKADLDGFLEDNLVAPTR